MTDQRHDHALERSSDPNGPRWGHGPERWGTGSAPWYVEEPQQPPPDNTTEEEARE